MNRVLSKGEGDRSMRFHRSLGFGKFCDKFVCKPNRSLVYSAWDCEEKPIWYFLLKFAQL